MIKSIYEVNEVQTSYKCSANPIKAEIVTVFLCAAFEIKAGRTRHPLWCCGNREFAIGSTKDIGNLLPKLSIIGKKPKDT